MARKQSCPFCGLHKPESIEKFTGPGDRLYPVADRLDAIVELMDLAAEDCIEISESALRGLSNIIGDIKGMLVEATGAIESDFVDLEKKGAHAGREETQNGKDSTGLVGEQAPKKSITKAKGIVN
jgi:hypothetical protein